MDSDKVFFVLTIILNILIYIVYTNTNKIYNIDFDYFLLDDDEDLPDILPSN